MSATNKAKGVKYTFSGHESFLCKSLWLKKGYDFVLCQGPVTRPKYPDFISERAYALCDAARWWYEYGKEHQSINNL